MFLIRCFKLEKEYDEYINKGSPSKKHPKDPLSSPVFEAKPRSDTVTEEMKESVSALPDSYAAHTLTRSLSVSAHGATNHATLGRSVSAGIYEDDQFLVNYQKYGRDGVPFVFDDRKTRTCGGGGGTWDLTVHFCIISCRNYTMYGMNYPLLLLSHHYKQFNI